MDYENLENRVSVISALWIDPLSMTVLRRELEVKAKPLLCCPARA